jgi:hypothetical protein
MLLSEKEGPNEQHEIEQVEGRGGGSVTKGRNRVVVVVGGGGGIKGLIMIVFLSTITLSDKAINMMVDILGDRETKGDTTHYHHFHLHHHGHHHCHRQLHHHFRC